VGIFDRLGDVIKSYLNDEDGRIFGNDSTHPKEGGPRGDPDLESAWDDLDEFLKGRNGPQGKAQSRSGTDNWGGRTGDWNSGWSKAEDRESSAGGERAGVLPPEELRPDFTLLGVPFGASPEECKAAYKRLLKLHHPDRHAGHEGNMRKATEKSARINAAYDRIEKWRTEKRI
jgi:hypothetical protein